MITMQAAPLPQDEKSRITALHLLNILDTQPEERFDRLTRMAKRLFNVPIATVTLVDADRQWFKSSVGVKNPETPRDISFCGHAIAADEILLVPDARQDERFFDNPLVSGDPNIRFYAGCPLKVGNHNLGTLCVIDDKPREFGDEERQLLKDLAKMAEEELSAVQLATTDHLTQISNRRGFELLALHVLKVCTRIQKPAAAVLFDLDHFKRINDKFGHAAGDQALRVFAAGLVAVFRESDVIARLGGDEFAVLMTGAAPDAIETALDRLQDWLRSNNSADQTGYELRFSAGQAGFDPRKPASVEDLLATADAAMYEHKKAARA